MSRVLIEIGEGHIVRNLLENDLLALLTDAGAEVLLVTPGARVPRFVDRYSQPGVTLRDLPVRSWSRGEQYEFALSQLLLRRGQRGLQRSLHRRLGVRLALARAPEAEQLVVEWKPDVVVGTHLTQMYSRGMIAAACVRGIPTLGNLNSWDNVYKGLRCYPDRVTCWSEHNREELCRLTGYGLDDVEIIGAPAFDAYFRSDAQWTREELAARMGLDPRRAILLFATLGQFQQNIDETSPLEALLREANEGRIQDDPQVVVRLHPWSREVYFGPLLRDPRVVVSRYEGYVPGLTWTPTRDEVVLAGNLLRHSDVVVTPGSTMSIEPAIFDTPTLVSVFNEYMPEVFEEYFRRTWLDQHFGTLYKNDWVPIARDAASMTAAINRALSDRKWYREGRRHIRERILGPLDGNATTRFAQCIVRTATSPRPR